MAVRVGRPIGRRRGTGLVGGFVAESPDGDRADAVPAATRRAHELLRERAAGLLAGRTGCRVGEAHALLLQLASEQGRDVRELAAEALAALEDVDTGGPRRAREVLVEAVSGADEDAVDAARPDPVAEDWTGTVRQVLDAMAGNHMLPLPLRDDAGAAEDFQTVSARRVGTGLPVSWSWPEAQSRLGERLAQTERLGNLGWVEWDVTSGVAVWSEQLYRIFEREPSAGPLSRAQTDALVVPADRPIVAQVHERVGRGLAVDATYRVRVDGRTKHVRLVADAPRDGSGPPRRAYGIVQDVTAREVSRARLVRAEERLREHQRSLAAEHRLAAQLQQIVLPIPATPLDLPGLRVAVRYLPAEQADRVGGDWYHADAAPDGSVIVTVGDVAGHGIRAATAMAQLRHALVALTATTTTDPAELLGYLNRLIQSGGDPSGVASAVVARYEPGSGALIWAQAGHPAPLRTRAGATVELDRPAGPLLGALSDARYDTARTTLSPDDLLIFYTDGLIERRGRPLDEGLGPVIATLNRLSAGGSRQPLADLLAQLDRANPEDDTCIVAARPLPPPGARTAAAGPGRDDTRGPRAPSGAPSP